MTIAPVVREVDVKCAPARAFELFTTRMAGWWPKGMTIGKEPFAEIVLEPYVGGLWLERDAQGDETRWGEVLAWDPPHGFVLAWRINAQFNYDPDFITEVELTFTANADGGAKVRLEHRKLENFGADAERLAGMLGGGWPTHLANFAEYAATHP